MDLRARYVVKMEITERREYTTNKSAWGAAGAGPCMRIPLGFERGSRGGGGAPPMVVSRSNPSNLIHPWSAPRRCH